MLGAFSNEHLAGFVTLRDGEGEHCFDASAVVRVSRDADPVPPTMKLPDGSDVKFVPRTIVWLRHGEALAVLLPFTDVLSAIATARSVGASR